MLGAENFATDADHVACGMPSPHQFDPSSGSQLLPRIAAEQLLHHQLHESTGNLVSGHSSGGLHSSMSAVQLMSRIGLPATPTLAERAPATPMHRHIQDNARQ